MYSKGSIGVSFIAVFHLSRMKAGADAGDLRLEVLRCLQKLNKQEKTPQGLIFDEVQQT